MNQNNKNKHIAFGGFGPNFFNLLIHSNYEFYKNFNAKYKSNWRSYENKSDLQIDVLSDNQRLMKE